MKRREEEKQNIMANWLTLLTRVTKNTTKMSPVPSRVFKCKTCNKTFCSFQALGGHRASHNKQSSAVVPVKRIKRHECSICGLEFPMGQALGGHMRRHKKQVDDDIIRTSSVSNNDKLRDGMMIKVLLDLNLTPYDENDELKLELFSPGLL